MEQSTIFLIVFGLLLLNYCIQVWMSRQQVMTWEGDLPSTKEGFEDKGLAEQSMTKWLEAPELFDDFYAQVYDQLAQGSVRLQAETGLALHLQILGVKSNVQLPAVGAVHEENRHLYAGPSSWVNVQGNRVVCNLQIVQQSLPIGHMCFPYDL